MGSNEAPQSSFISFVCLCMLPSSSNNLNMCIATEAQGHKRLTKNRIKTIWGGKGKQRTHLHGFGLCSSKLSHLGRIMLLRALGHDRSKAPGQPRIVVTTLVNQAIFFLLLLGKKKLLSMNRNITCCTRWNILPTVLCSHLT